MKKLFMSISLVLTLSVTLGILYWFYPHTNTPISSSVISSQEENTGMVSDSSVSDSSVSDLASSGSVKSPVTQTGNILEKTSSSSLIPVKFQKPNTEWKERDVTLTDERTLHYVFGEGNPKEVALDKEGIDKLYATCQDVPDRIDQVHHNLYAKKIWNLGFCDSETGRPRYMSIESEKALYNALSDPAWEKLINECQKNLTFPEEGWTQEIKKGVQENGDEYTFDRVFSPGFLDIEGFISVDRETGWKKLDLRKVTAMIGFLERREKEWGRGETITNPYGDCVDRIGGGIMSNLRETIYQYNIPY